MELPAPPPAPVVPGAEPWEPGFLLSSEGPSQASAFGTMLGLAASFTDVQGGLGQRQALGVTATLGATGTFTQPSGLTGHLRGSGSIGGGGAGFEGSLAGAFYLGKILRLGHSDGPFARAGASGLLAGNGLLYESRLTLPEAQAGYQIFTHDLFFEAGARGGLVLAGRFDPLDGAGRKLGGAFDVGPYASAWTSWLRLDLEGHRFFGRDGEGDLDLVRAGLCLPFGGATACLDGRHARGEAPRVGGGRALVEATYVGLTLGLNPGE
ncbi:MAG TPA: hypothetical protein VFS00_16745 [Polyangiaceae bacterium]|nr:hypothetical protein [Polyangiaceae bacterium]